MDLLTFLPATFLGFTLCKYLSDERSSKIARKIPRLRLWRLELSPSIRVFVRGRVVHLHHWVSLSLILSITFFVNMGLLDYVFTKGLMVGGIVQGLTFPDFKQIIYRLDHTNNTSISSTTGVDNETS